SGKRRALVSPDRVSGQQPHSEGRRSGHQGGKYGCFMPAPSAVAPRTVEDEPCAGGAAAGGAVGTSGARAVRALNRTHWIPEHADVYWDTSAATNLIRAHKERRPMDYIDLRVAIADGIAELTLDRPNERNAFSGAMGASLARAYRECDGRDDVRAVIVTGARTAFCVAPDLPAGAAPFPR